MAPVANIASTVLASVTPQLAAIQNQLVQPGRGGADPMKAAAQLEQTITALNSVISKYRVAIYSADLLSIETFVTVHS